MIILIAISVAHAHWQAIDIMMLIMVVTIMAGKAGNLLVVAFTKSEMSGD